jgi:hypothetical protein
MLSESKEGLQNSLDELYRYCSNWKLQVNTDKSKIIVLKRGTEAIEKFDYISCVCVHRMYYSVYFLRDILI